jgi:murein L,D-transpeptidase YcbB/YkuD
MQRASFWCLLLALLGLLPQIVSAQSPPTIEMLVDAGRLEGMRWPDFRSYQPGLREFYMPTAYAPAWIRDGAPSAQALSMIQLFQDAWKKGLNPEDYDASRWGGRREALHASNPDVAAFDLALTVCAMRYVSALSTGRVNPQHLNFSRQTKQKSYDLATFLREQMLPATDEAAVIESVEPPFGAYRRTEQALVRYVQLAKEDDGEKLPVPAKAIDPGQPYEGVGRLTRLLRLVGDLPSDGADAAAPDAYSGALVDAVKHFQRRHGLDDDGRLGAATVKQLNVPLTDRVHQIELALERWRWAPSNFISPPIVANIPDFRLRTLDANNEVVMDMRVVVGKAMHTETPVFSGNMSYVVFRPYWNVPPGIMRRTIIPAIRRNRDYIANNRYEVVTYSGAVVTSGPISDDVLAQLQAGKLTVRQKPGPKNALGLVKLMFPNEHSVYLHSTPSTELFSRSRRDFSAGCIRVEKPAELTAWALRNNPGWPLERVEQAMQSGRDNVTVNLAQRIPVFIVYGTALAYANGDVHFYDDIYGHDKALSKALAQSEP